jgi:hypothetical protein
MGVGRGGEQARLRGVDVVCVCVCALMCLRLRLRLRLRLCLCAIVRRFLASLTSETERHVKKSAPAKPAPGQGSEVCAHARLDISTYLRHLY